MGGRTTGFTVGLDSAINQEVGARLGRTHKIAMELSIY